ncbi:MAG: hypothetical protein OJF47_001854 [Nitrospira sp.]|jgi:hypothetical protein|nr:MAG: hypothetical protein OJF47_001854 [Nitrospira sp.]
MCSVVNDHTSLTHASREERVSSMAGGNGSSGQRHYIVVVHGMGEQRHNESTVEVVNRFATARAKDKPASSYQAVLPASLSSLAMRREGGGKGWSEFKGIPVARPQGNASREAFDGTRATDTSGRNFRFVDMRWADILQDHQAVFGSGTTQWTAALLARLRPPFTSEEWSAPWVRPLLEAIKDTLLPIQGLLKWYSPETEKSIFQNVFGDVHLYGDYARTRGQAVRRFHAVLDQIHLRDYLEWCRDERTNTGDEYVPPVYTIIAHSLGSVLSFDALLYACAKESIRDGTDQRDCDSIPFPGYTEHETFERKSWLRLLSDLREISSRPGDPRAADKWDRFAKRYPQFSARHGATPMEKVSSETSGIPLLLWRAHVKHFISLGSPIDKFLTLWHQNYRHVGLNHCSNKDAKCEERCEDWLDDTIQPRITHYNLCDEQDPVGHHLDVAHGCAVYGKVFRTDVPVVYRDVVFRRYAVPGLAHVQYWKDQALFDGLINEVIDEASATQAGSASQGNKAHLGQFVDPKFVKDDEVYKAALIWAYIRIPLIASVITGLLLSYGWIGWWYWGFSPSSALALLAGMLLWVCPRPFEVYREEAKTEYVARKSSMMKRLLPWWPHLGIFANVVAGSVAWRRILIVLNHHRDQAFDVCEARKNRVRLSLRTKGNFVPVFRNRILWGIGVFLLAVAGTWCGRRYLCAGIGETMQPPWWYVAILSMLTLSTVYLMAMGYVGHTFRRVKKAMTPDSTTQPSQTAPSCSTG